MIRLSLSSFISAGTHLRKFAQLETSDTPGTYTDGVKEDSLVTLRDAYETSRKLFMFSLINAKSGLSNAADVIETEDGLLSKKEMKRLEATRSKLLLYIYRTPKIQTLSCAVPLLLHWLTIADHAEPSRLQQEMNVNVMATQTRK